jgi:hypothetical protein
MLNKLLRLAAIAMAMCVISASGAGADLGLDTDSEAHDDGCRFIAGVAAQQGSDSPRVWIVTEEDTDGIDANIRDQRDTGSTNTTCTTTDGEVVAYTFEWAKWNTVNDKIGKVSSVTLNTLSGFTPADTGHVATNDKYYVEHRLPFDAYDDYCVRASTQFETFRWVCIDAPSRGGGGGSFPFFI